MQIAKLCKLRQAYISAIACINLLARRIPFLSGVFPGEASDLCLTVEEKNHDAEMRFGASLHAKLDLRFTQLARFFTICQKAGTAHLTRLPLVLLHTARGIQVIQ